MRTPPPLGVAMKPAEFARMGCREWRYCQLFLSQRTEKWSPTVGPLSFARCGSQIDPRQNFLAAMSGRREAVSSSRRRSAVTGAPGSARKSLFMLSRSAA